MRIHQPNVSSINTESSASFAVGLCSNWVVYCQKACPHQMLNTHLRPAWSDCCTTEDSSDWMLYCNSAAIQETWEMGLFLEAESMDAVNKLSKRALSQWTERAWKKVEWQREGDVCGFINLEVVLLQYNSSICHNLPLQIVIDACVDYKYKSVQVHWCSPEVCWTRMAFNETQREIKRFLF